MKRLVQLSIVLLQLPVAPAAMAQHRTFTVDRHASQVAFTLGAAGHEVHGTFDVQSGSIDFDRAAAAISGSVVVAAGSGDTGNSGRDRKMHDEVLEASRFAQVTFAPKSYQGTLAASGDSELQVSGAFTLHGTPHNVTVPVRIHIDGVNLSAKAHFTIPYVQWGLKDPSVFILRVAKEVGVDVTLTGRVTP